MVKHSRQHGIMDIKTMNSPNSFVSYMNDKTYVDDLKLVFIIIKYRCKDHGLT